MQNWDVIIVGAGAAGLMCAIEAGKRGRSVLVLESSNKPGKKILMSGGGRCNFTNLNVSAENYISHNKHFCKSALQRYNSQDFIKLVQKHKISFHEKTLGQLFCDNKAHDILDMLLEECVEARVKIELNLKIEKIVQHTDANSMASNFKIKVAKCSGDKQNCGKKQQKDHESQKYCAIQGQQGYDFSCQSLVIATGGLSIPTLGSSPFGYQVAAQFGINVWPTRAGLVPFTLHPADKEKFAALVGISVFSEVSVDSSNVVFKENILFTHRGLSGPAILQISSYWQPNSQAGADVAINLLPDVKLSLSGQTQGANKLLKNVLAEYLPKRVVEVFLDEQYAEQIASNIGARELDKIMRKFYSWRLIPSGTEGYRTAEVTLGGVDCAALSSKTMEANTVKGLYFIGEVVDVTGWLGGYNFQWAWSSGWAAGQYV